VLGAGLLSPDRVDAGPADAAPGGADPLIAAPAADPADADLAGADLEIDLEVSSPDETHAPLLDSDGPARTAAGRAAGDASALAAAVADAAAAPDSRALAELRAPADRALGLRAELLLAGALPDLATAPAEQQATWTAIARAMARLAPDHHTPERPLGRALHDAAVSERTVLSLTSAAHPEAERQLLQAVDALRRARETGACSAFDWRPVAAALVDGPRGAPLHAVLRDYYLAYPNSPLRGDGPPDDWELEL
jgi:hypothetical protein